MELSDPKTIAELLSAPDSAMRPEPANPTGSNSPKRHRGVKLSRCKCAACPRCRENARWERIFQEKFADPDYYAPRPVRHGSPLW